MFTESELKTITAVQRGCRNAASISESTGISIAQTYRIISRLTDREILRKGKAGVELERQPYIAALVMLLDSTAGMHKSLSGHVLDILCTLDEEHTAQEISEITGIDQSSIYNYLRDMLKCRFIIRNGHRYMIDHSEWPEIIRFVRLYNEYRELIIPSVPIGSIVYLNDSVEGTVFGYRGTLDLETTAFSEYSEYGVKIYSPMNYYTTSEKRKDIRSVFIDSLHVIQKDTEWRLRMLALIFYCKNKNELGDIDEPLMDEFERVLRGEKVEHWVPLREMQERADMYGVTLA